jgi:uracil-DNA glycosylase
MDQHPYFSFLEIQTYTRKQTMLSTPSCNKTRMHQLSERVVACKACPLHESRTQTVFGTGNLQAKLMVIGEATGFHEDKQG